MKSQGIGKLICSGNKLFICDCVIYSFHVVASVHENEDVPTSPNKIEPTTIYVYIYLYVWIFQTPVYYRTHRSEYHLYYPYLIWFYAMLYDFICFEISLQKFQ